MRKNNDTANQPSKFRTKNWVEVNEQSREMYNVSNQIKFKTLMIRSNLCDYSDRYIPMFIIVPNSGTAVAPDNRKKWCLKIVLHLLTV